MPTVSVVMPTHNRAHLIEPVIRSILDQDYRDIELLIIDDGSTDNTEEIINSILKKDNRLRYLKQSENCGVGCARAIGLEETKDSKYIALADSDDLWIPNRLTLQVKILDKYPLIDILFGDFDNINHVQNTRASGMKQKEVGLRLVQLKQLEESLYLIEGEVENAVLRSNFIATPTIVMRRKIIDRTGGFNRNLKSSEDTEFVWRASVLGGAKFAYVDLYLIERHVMPDSNTAQGTKPLLQRLDSLEACRMTAQDLPNRHILEANIRASETRTYINLLNHYGSHGERSESLRTFSRSLKHGLSFKILFLTTLCLIGPFTVKILYSGLRFRKKVTDNESLTIQ